MSFAVKILADSIFAGVRLTTFELTYPRFIHSEFMTHRSLCLAGDSLLEFDLPSGSTNGHKRIHTMRIDEFVDKWHNGARRFSIKERRKLKLSKLNPEKQYTPTQIRNTFNFSNLAINQACREGLLKARKEGRTWIFTGKDFIQWRKSNIPEHSRFDIRERLQQMNIRQINEITGRIQTSQVVDCCYSGEKPVFTLKAGELEITASYDHKILTSKGWMKLGKIKEGDLITVRRFGKITKKNPYELQKFGGEWKQRWNKKIKDSGKLGKQCVDCGALENLQVHHIIPAFENTKLVFKESNVKLVCKECHKQYHKEQTWNIGNGNYLYGDFERVDSIEFRGIEKTYDLEIAGEFPNFIANGIVVHNSRNAASSRAIPVDKKIQVIVDNPVLPIWVGQNKAGMQAEKKCDNTEASLEVWKQGRFEAVNSADRLLSLGVHKQLANRILEPWSWITVVATATEWANFFNLRVSEFAQPEFDYLAGLMLKEYFENAPRVLFPGEWHLPYVSAEEWENEVEFNLVKMSVARCAKVSYERQGDDSTKEKLIELHDRLLRDKHMSPFEHQAFVEPYYHSILGSEGSIVREFQESWSGNFRGFTQYRKTLEGENQEKLDAEKLLQQWEERQQKRGILVIK